MTLFRGSRAMLALLLFVQATTGRLNAAWTISDPTPNEEYTATAGIGVSGTADASSVAYTVKVKASSGVVLGSSSGTSYGVAPGIYYNASVAAPTGGWGSGTPSVVVKPVGGDEVSVTIKIDG